MTWAASHLAERKKSSEEVYKMKDFYRQKDAWVRKLYLAKKWIGYCQMVFFMGVRRGLLGSLPSSCYQVVLDWLVEDTISGRAHAVINLNFGLVT